MIYIKSGIAFVLLGSAVYMDIKKGKIANLLTGAGFILGLFCTGIEGGRSDVLYCIKKAVVVVISLFFLFVIKGLGAGDIKLLTVLAVFFPENIISIIIMSFFAGAAISLLRMGMRALRKRPVYIKKETIHFSVPIAMAAAIAQLCRLLR